VEVVVVIVELLSEVVVLTTLTAKRYANKVQFHAAIQDQFGYR
jgi:hypothetical protein